MSRLQLEEAIDMLAVDMESDPPAFDAENRIVDSEEIIKMCGNLIRLDTIAGSQRQKYKSAKGRTIAAAHTSVIDFLTTQPIQIGSEETCRLSKAKANLRMAETCLIYLRHFSVNDITLTEENIASYPFARSCAFLWHIFYQKMLESREQLDMTRLNDLIIEMFSSPTATLKWVRLANPEMVELKWLRQIDPDTSSHYFAFGPEISQVKPAIYYAALLGLPDIIKRLIQEGNPLDQVVGPPFGTPLVAASAEGLTDVISLLLDSGADPNLSGCFRIGTPLAAAICKDEYAAVELLLSREGVDVNGRRHPPLKATNGLFEKGEEYRYLRTTLQKNMNGPMDQKGQKKFIEIGTELIKIVESIEDWSNNNSEGRYCSNEIERASSEQRSNHLTRLPSTGVRENIDDVISDELDLMHCSLDFRDCADDAWQKIEESSESMAYIAAENSRLDILKIVLEAGADPNSRGGFYGTALQKACAHDGNEAVIQTLLKNGARTDVYGGWYGSPLIAACRRGSFRTVEILIKASADLNRLGKVDILACLSLRTDFSCRCTMVLSVIPSMC